MNKRLALMVCAASLFAGIAGCGDPAPVSRDGGPVGEDSGARADARVETDASMPPDDASADEDASVPTDGGGACDDVDCSSLDDECNVGTCDPATGTCSATPRADGTSCDDGAACTDGDSCTAGTCTPGPLADCSSLTDGCNVGMCDPATGACAAVPVADGTSCDDGLACTTADVCSAGACGGAATDCSALTNGCNVGTCDAATGACAAVPVVDGTTCDDGLACTTVDVCSAGTCGGAAVDCSSLTDACNVGTCDATTGACAAVPVTNGTACDDGLACTTADVCTAGACGGAAVDCSSLTDACNVGTCDAVTGACSAVPVVDGTSCDDANSCTTGDVCGAGVCGGSRVVRFDFESGITHEWTMTGGTAGWVIDPSGRTGSGFSNADIGNSQDARAQLDVRYATGGTVSFWRRTSTESGFDFLRFFIDGVQQAQWSGTNAFARFEYPVAAGSHTFEWRYSKDSSVSSGTDTVTIDDIDLVGGVTVATFERGIPSSFVMSGTAPWIVSANAASGTQAIQNGDIADSQTSIATTSVRLPAAGNVSFARATSTESSFDFLRFYVDGVQVGSWSGTVAYSRVSFPLTAGNHTLEWRYTKDSSISTGADTVYVDDIEIAVTACAPVTVAYPEAAATVCRGTTCTTLGAIGGTRYYETGNYLEQTVTFAGVSTLGSLTLDFDVNDQTQGCAVGAAHTFDVQVNGTTVGTYSFTTPAAAPAGTISLNPSYAFPGIAGTGAGSNQYTIRMVATSTVCGGGNSWMWIPGGTAAGL